MTRPTPSQWGMLVPALLVVAVLLIAPILLMAVESFRPFVAGREGAGAGWTLLNYTELFSAAYLFYFADTFCIGFLVCAMAIGLGAPLAWMAARTKRHGVRLGIFGLLIGLLFLSLITRLYAIQMTWGATGPLAIFDVTHRRLSQLQTGSHYPPAGSQGKLGRQWRPKPITILNTRGML